MVEKGERYICTVKLGPKGQIVIPKEVRELFGIGPGDSMMLLADKGRGIALQKPELLAKIANAVFEGKVETVLPGTSEKAGIEFAQSIEKELKKGGEKDDG